MIGVTVFYSDGKALQVAGPAGALLAFALVGIVALCVMECVSELIQMFPTPNAIVEFVRIFVDEDLAWIIGIGYWLEERWIRFSGDVTDLSAEGKPTLQYFHRRSLPLRTSPDTGI